MTLLINIFSNNQTDIALLILRLIIAAIFFVHGIAKIKMWNMKPTEQMSANRITFMKYLGVAETLGAISSLLGFLTQISAIGLSIVMLGAMWTKINQWKVKFTVRDRTGWEFDLMILAGTLALFLLGAGAISIDKLINFY